MKKEDAKIGQRVIYTSDKKCNYGHAPNEDRMLRKGDIVTILEITNETSFLYSAFNGNNFTLFEWFEPLQEIKKMLPEKWYAKVDSLKMRDALVELATKNNFRICNPDGREVAAVASHSSKQNDFEFDDEFNGWERSSVEVTLAEVIAYLSVQQKKPLTAGGKSVKVLTTGIEVDGVTLSLEIVKTLYASWKRGPIGHTIKLIPDSTGKKYMSLKVGCTKLTTEEVEAIARELKLS